MLNWLTQAVIYLSFECIPDYNLEKFGLHLAMSHQPQLICNSHTKDNFIPQLFLRYKAFSNPAIWLVERI